MWLFDLSRPARFGDLPSYCHHSLDLSQETADRTFAGFVPKDVTRVTGAPRSMRSVFLAARWVTLLSPAEVDVHLRLPTSTANVEHRILDMDVAVAATLGSTTATDKSKTSALRL
ncbi:hypothetical protein HPB47_022581 [Ixodes persulcatus]|uniref:Uncharacterized protein n=1 Tax=Ixodes persulcatus TaxID=34615 RepID=A0AC60QCN5_IXOPE|nr:hypothetical protein HPB47_022581 [Ixodes persulcatus]